MFYNNSACAFKITGVFFVERSKVKKVAPKNRNHTAISYRISGESQFRYGETSLVASAGSVAYFPQKLNFERSSTSESLIIIHLQGFGDTDHNIEIINNANILEPLFRKLLFVWETEDSSSYNRSVQILYKIFETIQNLTNNQNSFVPNIIKPGVELLQQRYKDSSLRISDLADACFISEVYFREVFHRHFNKSPQKALATMRYNYVCELLLSGYYTQKEAAQLSGFSDVKYFRTAFKKHFGVTPHKYIKNNANQ